MASFTPNYDLEKPVVGGDLDVWGGKLNSNFDKVDTAIKARADATSTVATNLATLDAEVVKKDGSVAMTGPLVLPATNPTLATHATNKSYVDTALSSKLNTTTANTTFAPLASPSLTGTPVAPTATAGTNTTQIATTAFVNTSVGAAIKHVWKTADQTAALNSVTFQADNTLLFTMTAGQKYWFSANLIITAAVTQGVKVGISATQTPQSGRASSQGGNVPLATITTTTTSVYASAAAHAYTLVSIRGFVLANATTGGDFKIFFAQNVAAATAGTAPIMRAGSMIEYGPLG